MADFLNDRIEGTASLNSILKDTAKTLKDSMNLAMKFNLKSSMENIEEDEDIVINIEETVVMISISDKMLFNSGSYRIINKANDIE